MSLIEVRAPGLLTTVQDLGREGFGPMGVSPSGAADAVALRVGNRLAGNAEGAPGLEMTLLGGSFFFREAAVVALTGSDFAPTLDDQRVETWSSVEIRAGQTLQLGPTRAGARCYLSVRGGIDVKSFLGSASTHLLSGLGGFEGRALRKGDVLKVGRAIEGFRTFRKRNLARRALEKLAPRKVLRVTAGPQSDWFSKEARKLFYRGTYRVGGIQPNGVAAGRYSHCAGPGRRDDFRGRFVGSAADYGIRVADYSVCGTADYRRVSEDCQCDFCGHQQSGPTAAAR